MPHLVTMPRGRSLGLALTALVLLTGCSGAAEEEAVKVTLTPKVVAAITLDVLQETAQRSRAVPGTAEDEVGAELQFAGIGSYTGDRLTVTVRSSREGEQEQDLCRELAKEQAPCESLSTERSTRLWLTWRTEQREVDPGVVTLTRIRGGETTLIELTGPVITGDPRTVLNGDRFSVPSLVKVLEDPRLDLVTDEDAIEMADRVASWQDDAGTTPVVTPPATPTSPGTSAPATTPATTPSTTPATSAPAG